MKYIKSKQINSLKSPIDIDVAEDKIFKYFVSYAILIAYVLAGISSTTDLMLLQSIDGMRLPFIDSRVSIRGFYLSAPLIVAAASLYMAREFFILNAHKLKKTRNANFVFTISQPNANGKLFGVNGELDSIVARFISYFVFFLLGPAVILLITIRFADYQDKFIFLFHLVIFFVTSYFSWVFYCRTEQLFLRAGSGCAAKATSAALVSVIIFKILVCIDVIFIPSHYSLSMYVKQNTNWLTNSDNGIFSIVPHLRIDRTTAIWEPKTKEYSEISFYNHNKTSRDYFFSRAAGIDLRGRSLKYLDISFQIAPRIWAHEADLSGANLSFAKIPGSNFINTNFYGADLSMSVVDGSRFFAATMTNTMISNSSFRGTVFDNTNFSRAFLKYVNFAGSSFFGVRIQKSNLDGIDFSGADFFETTIKDNSMIIDAPSPIFPSLLAARNDFGEFSDAFYENEEAAISAIAKQFCKKSLSASDELALKGITDIYLMMGRNNSDRMRKLVVKFNNLSCDKAIELIPNEGT